MNLPSRVSSLVPADPFQGEPHSRYCTVIAAIVESALVNWIGLLLFGIANVAPHGRIIVSQVTAELPRLTELMRRRTWM